MTKPFRGMLFGSVAAVMILIAPVACKSTKKNTKPVTVPMTSTGSSLTQTTETVPPVETTVKTETTDFVKTETVESRPTVENLPNDPETLNRTAADRGWIRDAFFGYDDSTLTTDAQSALSATASWLKSHPEYNLLIEGHCDERGTEQYNLALGDHRANIAREYLATLGVDAARMRTVSYGLERPFDPGHNEEAWAKNRRAHLVLVGR
jgi:peptidoglycan-associated lipoprotein